MKEEEQGSWRKKVSSGKKLMRDGIDYVNNDKRYDAAFDLLSASYRDAKNTGDANHCELARICLWTGITLNENNDISPPIKRNKGAIYWYKKGLEHVNLAKRAQKLVCEPRVLATVEMSLNNSLGVACHHLHIGEPGWPIPRQAFAYYRKARDIYKKYPDFQPTLKRIMRKVESNSGMQICRDGDHMKPRVLQAGGFLATYTTNCI